MKNTVEVEASGYTDQIIKCAQDCWNAIAYDVLSSSSWDGCDGETVREIVLDNIRRCGSPEDFTLFDSLSYEEKIALMQEAFPDEWYGF